MDDSFLDQKKMDCDCNACAQYRSKLYVQTIKPHNKIHSILKKIVNERLLSKYDLTYKNYTPNILIEELTFSIHAKGKNIGFHIDEKVQGKSNVLKFLVYLNKVEGGGTIFVPPGKTKNDTSSHLNITPSVGDLVIFDIDLLHSGASINSGIKYAIGFRLEFDSKENYSNFNNKMSRSNRSHSNSHHSHHSHSHSNSNRSNSHSNSHLNTTKKPCSCGKVH